MTTTDDQQDEQYLNPQGGMVGKAFGAVPPEVQQMLNVKPGRTSERIRQVISWAAAVDPEVLRVHQRHEKGVRTLEDIRDLPVSERDRVARHFAAQYRHRAALTGAVTALPGGLWALVGMGADVQLTAIYAVRMAAKVAQSYGYDTSAVEEQAHLADVLALAAGIDSLRGVGNWLTREGMAQVLPDLLPRVLARLSVELTTEQAAKWIGRIIPGVSAVVGGAVDYTFLRAAGERAIAHYHNRALNERATLAAPAAVPALPPGGATTTDAPAAAASVMAPRIIEAESAPAAPQTPPADAPPLVTRDAHVVAAPAEPVAPAAPVAPARPQREQPAKPMREPRRRRPLGVYLWLFVIVAMAATIVACVALGAIISSAIHLPM
ncbi:MAG TPA: EcsC family protein [Ktedonobacterales bacterium]|nr:EcsC family protein [Ktedonobacterales bacterium]